MKPPVFNSNQTTFNMGLFDVYNQYDIYLTKGKGCYVYDSEGNKYLDLYGGHGVISIGHGHEHHLGKLKAQLDCISFYSNAVKIEEQFDLADKLTQLSGYHNYNLFLCNSGAEANENALKLASFETGKAKVIAFKNSFHGRTTAALNVTDNPNLSSLINQNNFEVEFCELNDFDGLTEAFQSKNVAAVIVEGIQGVGGLDEPSSEFLGAIYELCEKNGAVSILDEIQSGCGRSGHFFAHQVNSHQPDIVTMAKGMGNGFPLAGLLIHPKIKAKKGMLGTTFGGNYLACAAASAVLDVLQGEQIIDHVNNVSNWLKEQLSQLNKPFKIKGRGLMLGIEFEHPAKEIQQELLFQHLIFTGGSSNPNLLRILPPLTIRKEELQHFIDALNKTV